MKTKNILNRLLVTLLLVVAAATTQAQQANNFYISRYSTNEFKVLRKSTDKAERVRYRTVSLNAIAGAHFTPAVGILEFAVGEKEKTVTVEEMDITTVPLFCRYLYGKRRDYRFEILDMGGFRLDYNDREIYYGDEYNLSGNYVNPNIVDMVYLKRIYNDPDDYSTKIMSTMGASRYVDVVMRDDYVEVDDSWDYCYKFNCYTSSVFQSDTSPSGINGLRQYFSSIGVKLYATVYFEQTEKDEGYQYIQILADNDETYDGKDPDGNVNTPSLSLYKACFEFDGIYDKKMHQFFPHRYDYMNRAEGNQDESYTEFPSENTLLYAQKFRNNNYRASDAGALVLDPTVEKLTVRFDANGKGEDTWGFKNLTTRLALCDKEQPRLIDASISNGQYAKGTPFAVTLVFNETVKAQDVVLHTNWGDLTTSQTIYAVSSNTLTFPGTIPDNIAVGTKFIINGYDGTITDIPGNSFNGSIKKTFDTVTVGQSYNFPITYNLEGGTLTIPNPSTYNYETNTFTLRNPVREGYTFLGWTGSNGDTPQTEVTVTRGSHGDLHFAANWTPALKTGDLNGDDNVDVTDVSLLIDVVLGKPVTLTEGAVADLDGDGNTDVTDVSVLIDIVLGK